jgi:hypothetical protein
MFDCLRTACKERGCISILKFVIWDQFANPKVDHLVPLFHQAVHDVNEEHISFATTRINCTLPAVCVSSSASTFCIQILLAKWCRPSREIDSSRSSSIGFIVTAHSSQHAPKPRHPCGFSPRQMVTAEQIKQTLQEALDASDVVRIAA